MAGVTAAYGGVHAIYQLALAAHEAGRLDGLLCSLLDAPGKWGGVLSRVLGPAALTSRRCPALPPRLVREYPWPLLLHAARGRWRPGNRADWFQANDWFDRWAASHLRRSGSRVFVGAETCAEHSLRAARALGMATVLDCEQVHPAFLEPLLARAAAGLGLPPPPPVDSPRMAARKASEYRLADVILVPSEVGRRSFLERGFAPARLVEIPLWADPALWFPAGTAPRPGKGPLQVLFAGGISLRKGVPYLLEAARQCGRGVALSLAGPRDPRLEPILKEYAADFHCIGPQTKPALRAIYQRSDVLVLPSLVDAFGLVAMEAMACGLPVIVSENCGVPVPDPAWRVPIMDAGAIAERLSFYAGNRAAAWRDGRAAAYFAQAYTPEAYRRRAAELFMRLLDV